jgi:hypothetical protein
VTALRRTILIQGPPGPNTIIQAAPASWTPGAIDSGAFAKTTVSLTGSVVGLPVLPPAWSAALPDGMWLSGQVTTAGTVTVYMFNLSGSTQTIGAGYVYVEALTS